MNDDSSPTTSKISVSSSSSSSSSTTSSETESSTPYTNLPTSSSPSSPAVDKEAAEIGKVPQSNQVAFISAQRQLVPPSNNYTSTPRTPAEFTPLTTPSDHHSVQSDVIDHQTSDNRTNHEEQGDPQRHDLSPTRLKRVETTDIDRARSSTPTQSESGSKLHDDQPGLTRTTVTDRHGSEEHSSGEASDRSDKPALQNDVTGVDNRIEHTRPFPTREAPLLGDYPSRLPTASTSSSDTETIRAIVRENGELTSDALPTNEARGSFSSTRTAVNTPKQQHSELSTSIQSQNVADDPSEQRSIGGEQGSFLVEQRSSHHDNHTIIITSSESATSRKSDLSLPFHVPGQDDRRLHQNTPGHLPSPEQRHDQTTDKENPLPEDVPSAITQPIPTINLSPPDISVVATQSRSSLPPTSSSSSSPPAAPDVPTEESSQPGLRDSSSQGVAQGGGMNEGPGLVADLGRSIRGYGAAPGPDYNLTRPYSADYRADIDQSIPYEVPTGFQDSQGVVRGDYSGSHFQRYPGAPGENINKAPLALSNEPLKTKIKPKGRGKRKAEQVVQVEVETGGVPNPSYPPPQRNGAGVNPTDPLGSGRNMEVSINHDYAAGNAPPPYDDYAYPANGLPSSSSYDPAQGFSSPSGQGQLVQPQSSNGAHHLPQSNYSAVGPLQNLEQSPQAQRPAGPSYNAMAGPSNPYLQGLPPAIQSQMPGGADYGSLPVGVSGGKIFKCMGFPGCEMTFTRSEHLARHVRKHTGERPFPCHCGKAFSRLDNLRQHAATVHNDSVDLNDRMLRALAPVHAALSQRAGKEQRQRGEVLSVPKTAAERAKSVQPKKPKKTAPRGIVEGNGGHGPIHLMQSPHHFGPEMPPPPPVLIPGQPGFQLQHPISSSITSNPDVVAHYPTQMVPPPAGGPLHAMPMSHAQAHQPHPPPWFPPHAIIEGQRPESSYRPGTDGRPGTGYASHQTSAGVSPHLPNPPQSSSLSGYGNYVRSPQEHPPAGFQYEPFPHGIRPGSKHPVSLQLHHPPRSAGPTMGAAHSAASVDGRFTDRPGTASSPYLQIPSLTSAPPYATTYAHAQPPSAGAQLSFSPHPPRSSHPAEIYQQHPGTAPSSGRPGTGILQHQQQQSMPLHSGPYQSSHGSSGHSSRLTGNSSQHSMGRVTHQQIQEIYGNSGATQESPFSYHPPPTASQPPPTQYSFGSGVPDYGVQSHGFQPDMDGRKRKTEELESDAYDMERRKGQKTELGKVATGVFYPGRAERRNSLAISSLITGDGQNQIQPPPEQDTMGPDYGNGYYQDNGEPGISDQHNMASYTFGNVGGADYGYNAGAQPSYMLEEQQQQQQQQQHLQQPQPHGGPGKPGHHAMDVKARALLDNGGYDV